MNKIKTILICLFCILVIPTLASPPSDEEDPPLEWGFDGVENPLFLTYKYIKDLDYLKALRTLQGSKDNYNLVNNIDHIASYYQILGTIYSFNGICDSAIMFHDQAKFQGILFDFPKKGIDTVNLKGRSYMDAKEYIMQNIGDREVVMINEAHHIPQHRIFAKSLLKEFYDMGFRSLCLETLTYKEHSSRLMGYKIPPLFTELGMGDIYDGYYLKEPCFAEFVREAIRLGYEVHSYSPDGSEHDSFATRDSLSAIYAHKSTNGFTKGRTLIYAGYDHTNTRLDISMYSYIKKLYGIDAYSINLTEMHERANQYYENANYIAFIDTFDPPTPSVLLGPSGEVENRGWAANMYVYMPRTKYSGGRPDWLLEGGARKAIEVKVRHKTTAVIKAFHANEKAIKQGPVWSGYYVQPSPILSDDYRGYKVVPVDQVIIDKNSKRKTYELYLPEGVYLIQHQDAEQNVLKEYFEQIKFCAIPKK